MGECGSVYVLIVKVYLVCVGKIKSFVSIKSNVVIVNMVMFCIIW